MAFSLEIRSSHSYWENTKGTFDISRSISLFQDMLCIVSRCFLSSFFICSTTHVSAHTPDHFDKTLNKHGLLIGGNPSHNLKRSPLHTFPPFLGNLVDDVHQSFDFRLGHRETCFVPSFFVLLIGTLNNHSIQAKQHSKKLQWPLPGGYCVFLVTGMHFWPFLFWSEKYQHLHHFFVLTEGGCMGVMMTCFWLLTQGTIGFFNISMT